jgi:hypothetical protein
MYGKEERYNSSNLDPLSKQPYNKKQQGYVQQM